MADKPVNCFMQGERGEKKKTTLFKKTLQGSAFIKSWSITMIYC